MRHPLFTLLAIILFLSSLSPALAQAYSYTCTPKEANGRHAWLQGRVTAGGAAAEGVSVYLSCNSYLSGYSCVWDSACTDANGNYSFYTYADPATECSSCYESAHCNAYCITSETYSWYGTLVEEGYKITAHPAYGSDESEIYSSCEEDGITLDFTGTQTKHCSFRPNDYILRTRVVDEFGSPITSGLTLYVSGSSSSAPSAVPPKKIVSSFTDAYVPTGTFSIYVSCTDWQNCNYGCITSEEVTITQDSSAITEVSIKGLNNNATLLAQVKDSKGNPINGSYVGVNSSSHIAYGTNSSGTCYAWGSCTTENGECKVFMPPGSYTASAYSPSGNTHTSAEVSGINLTANETTAQAFTLYEAGAATTLSVIDANGNAVQGAWGSANTDYSRGGTQHYAWGQSDSNGKIAMQTVDGLTYNFWVSHWSGDYDDEKSTTPSLSNCPREGMMTAQAPTEKTFTFDIWDHWVNFIPSDEQGNALSLNDWVNIKKTGATSDDWCWTSASLNRGKKLASNTSYDITYYGGWNGYISKDEVTKCATGGSGDSSECNIPMLKLDTPMWGYYKDGRGNRIEELDTSYLYMNLSNGPTFVSVQADRSQYSGKVAKGKEWCASVWLDWNSQYAPRSSGLSSNCKMVTEETQLDLTFLRSVYIKGRALTSEGDPVKWAWCTASAKPSSSHDGDNDTWRMYAENGSSTYENGEFQIIAGGGATYYVTCHLNMGQMENDDITTPKEVAIETKEPEPSESIPTYDVGDLVFRKLDGRFDITTGVAGDALRTHTAEEIISDAEINCFSDSSGKTTGKTGADGTGSINCTTLENWNCGAVHQIGSDLYVSEVFSEVCQVSTPVHLKLNFVMEVPDYVSVTGDAGNALNVVASDGTTFSCPAGAAGSSGETVTLSINPQAEGFPALPGARLACYIGYDIKITNSSGNSITKLNTPCKVGLPLCQDHMTDMGLTTSDLSLKTLNTSFDVYIDETQVTFTDDMSWARIDHLTKFAVTGNGNLTAVDGDTETASEEAERTGETATGATSGGGSCACRISGDLRAGNYWLLVLLAMYPLWRIPRKNHLRREKSG